MLELGQDYLSAGLLDRAEDLFLELAESDGYRVQALRQLIDIYEQEKDWPKAIASARNRSRLTLALLTASKDTIGTIINGNPVESIAPGSIPYGELSSG